MSYCEVDLEGSLVQIAKHSIPTPRVQKEMHHYIRNSVS